VKNTKETEERTLKVFVVHGRGSEPDRGLERGLGLKT